MSQLERFAAALLAPPAEPARGAIASRLDLHAADTLGAMVAGALSAEGRELARPSHGPLLFGGDFFDRLALTVAQTRLTEIDDIHMASCTTIGSVIAPVAFLLGAETGASDARIAAGLRAGYDAMARLGMAVDGARILYRGVWPTYLTAPAGAAAASAAILGLGESQTADALALALAQMSGAPGGPASGRNARWLFAGWAAAAGVRASLAAREGFGGDRNLLDGDWFAKTHGIAFDPTPLGGDPGASLLDVSMKPWCTAKQAASALSAFQDLLDAGIQPADIAAVRVFVPEAYRAMIAHRPPGRVGRIVSIAWQCALAALHRGELLDIDRADHGAEPEFVALTQKVEVIADGELARHFPARYPARVEIETKDGARLEKTVIDAPGDPNRALDIDSVRAKFLAVTARHLDDRVALAVFESARQGEFGALLKSPALTARLPFPTA